MNDKLTLTNEEIRQFNLWLFDNPEYQRMSWREQVMFWRAIIHAEEAAA